MTITIDIPGTKGNDIIVAFSAAYNYSDTIDGLHGGIPNPQTPQQFTLEQIRTYIRSVYRGYKVAESRRGKAQVISDADSFTEELTVT